VQAAHRTYRRPVTFRMAAESQAGHPKASRITLGAYVQATEFHTQFCKISLSPSRIPPVLNQAPEGYDGLLFRDICLFLLSVHFQGRKKFDPGNLLADG